MSESSEIKACLYIQKLLSCLREFDEGHYLNCICVALRLSAQPFENGSTASIKEQVDKPNKKTYQMNTKHSREMSTKSDVIYSV